MKYVTMISKDDVFRIILDDYKISNKPVSLAKIKRKVKDDSLQQLLDELEKDGKIIKVQYRNKVSYKPLLSSDDNPILEEIRSLRSEINKVYDLLQKIVESKNVSDRELDEAYDRIKDSLGYAPLEKIRIELGLSKEEFYSKFRKYIEENYDLIAGGEEGFLRKGVIYGIIKRRR